MVAVKLSVKKYLDAKHVQNKFVNVFCGCFPEYFEIFLYPIMVFHRKIFAI